MVDQQCRILDSNCRFREIFDLSTALVGTDVKDFFAAHSEVPQPEFSEKSIGYEFNLKAHLNLFWELSVSPLDTGKDASHGHILTIRDVTEKKEAEHKILTANVRLKEQLAEIEGLQSLLREEAVRDHLTGLYNRRYLHEALSQAIPKAIRDNQALSFALLDIDKFKKVNDTYGHDMGDQVLIGLAQLLSTKARKADIVCRFGGEEFLIFFAGAGHQDAARRTDELRLAFQASQPVAQKPKIKATFSAGIATFPQDGMDMDALFKVADERLYLAKKSGRNRVVAA